MVLPPPWRFVAAGLGYLILSGIVHAVTRVFRTRHRPLGNRLLPHFGYFRLEVPTAFLVAATPPGDRPSRRRTSGSDLACLPSRGRHALSRAPPGRVGRTAALSSPELKWLSRIFGAIRLRTGGIL